MLLRGGGPKFLPAADGSRGLGFEFDGPRDGGGPEDEGGGEAVVAVDGRGVEE